MEKKKFIITAILIIASITLTVAFQVYWNFKNYKENKRQLISELQSVLDQSLDEYFNATAEQNIDKLKNQVTLNGLVGDSIINGNVQMKSIRNRSEETSIVIYSDSTEIIGDLHESGERFKKLMFSKGHDDTTAIGDIKNITSRIIVTISEDSVNLDRLDSVFSSQLRQRSIDLEYTLTQKNDDKKWVEKNQGERHVVQEYEQNTQDEKTVIRASSTFLLGGPVELRYENLTLNILKRSLAGITISVLITLFIAASLVYLYQTIKNQKELALIKNDLINNITHELKTPIATALTAMEGIKNFNAAKDPEKTDKYLDVSTMQLNKLSEMVEKLLETATLDNNSLSLKKEKVNINQLLEKIKNRFEVITNKAVELEIDDLIEYQADAFHLENAIANLVDNAVKYGGNEIRLVARQEGEFLTIKVEDNGGNIPSEYTKKVFDKFYRISTGNVHDVKGFGIGLFYSKNVAEQHGGSIALNNEKNKTTFSIKLP